MPVFLRLIFFLLLLQSSQLQAQSLFITGKVISAETGLPLAGASVYINNSTKGTVTNAKGEFTLGPFIPGRYNVVVSFVEFEKQLLTVDLMSSNMPVTFFMVKNVKEIKELLILTKANRMEYLEEFKKKFLGVTYAAEQCKIINIGHVQFASGSKEGEIVAYTDTILIVENPELGYRVSFDLLHFHFNLYNSESRFYGYSYYEEMQGSEKQIAVWKKRRMQVYEGSSMFFLRSLVNYRLQKDGFDMKILHKATITNGASKKSFYVASPVTEDSVLHLYSDSGYKIYKLEIADGLSIFLQTDTDLKKQLLRKRYLFGQPRTGTSSGITPFQPPIFIDETGKMLSVSGFYFEGVWMYERLADMLPEDFVPYK